MASRKIEEIAVKMGDENPAQQRETLRRLAKTTMSSKIIYRNADFFYEE